jgi:hypothetical protein
LVDTAPAGDATQSPADGALGTARWGNHIVCMATKVLLILNLWQLGKYPYDTLVT